MSPDKKARDKIIGDRLRTARMMVGLSQQALGRILGVSFQQIQKYESGQNRISSGSLYVANIAMNTGLPIEWFFGEGDASYPVKKPGSQRAYHHMLVFNKLTDEGQKRIHSMAKHVLSIEDYVVVGKHAN